MLTVYWIIGEMPMIDYPGRWNGAWTGHKTKSWVEYRLGYAGESQRLVFNRGTIPYGYSQRRHAMEALEKLTNRGKAWEPMAKVTLCRVVEVTIKEDTKYYLVPDSDSTILNSEYAHVRN